MKEFFEARNIAVIGASSHTEKIGHIVFKNLFMNKNLRVFPVNINSGPVLGNKTYKDVLEIPYDIDLAIIIVRAEFVPEVLEQCGRKRIKNIVIISAGFKEDGNIEGDHKISKIKEKYDLRILGPNVLGFIAPYRDMNASFFSGIPEKGKIAFVSQSGAIGDAILDIALSKGLGFSGFVSLGNMLDIDFNFALEYFGNDSKTEVILLYIESLKEASGRKFIELCKKISKNKKIIAIKAGKSQEGQKAARTHTASVSSASEIYSGAFKQAGIIEVESVREMLALGEIFARYKNLGKRACIVSNAGGAGVLASDALADKVKLVDIPEEILKKFDTILDKGYSRRNPLDILGDASAQKYKQVLEILDREKLFDFFIVLLTPQAMTHALQTVENLREIRKPVFCCFLGGKSLNSAKLVMKELKIINFEDLGDLGVLGKI